jgi:sulfatase modifying factor 1
LIATHHRLLLVCVIVGALGSVANGVTIATVPVGSPGNAPDTQIMLTDNTTGYGSVPYNYRIGTYDITNSQYAEFLNDVASTADPYGLWVAEMSPSFSEGAIARLGTGPYSYSVTPGYGNKPVYYVTWYTAIRFANWLTNGQGNGDTETGSYTILNGGNNSGTVILPTAAQRASWAATNSVHWLLPTENEWYKAAYYNPATGSYFTYPFQSNSPPAALAPPGNANSGNFSGAAFNFDGTGSYFTAVGAYPSSLSPFGAYDMGGDFPPWTESLRGQFYIARGGGGLDPPSYSAAVWRDGGDNASSSIRVVEIGGVPEPASIVLASLGVVGLLIFSKRLRADVCSFAEHRGASGG